MTRPLPKRVWISHREFARELGEERHDEHADKHHFRLAADIHAGHPGKWRMQFGSGRRRRWRVNLSLCRALHPHLFAQRERVEREEFDRMAERVREMEKRLNAIAGKFRAMSHGWLTRDRTGSDGSGQDPSQ